jgi:glycosyltransferase involved in cell wall biosynthesis
MLIKWSPFIGKKIFKMKIIQLNHSDINGGAARAAYRIHHALQRSGDNSTMMVNLAASSDWTVQGPQTNLDKLSVRIRPLGGILVKAFFHTGNPVIHSPAVLPSSWPKRLNKSDADVLNLHWIGEEMLSIRDIGRLNKPIVWTLHDMWAFCGAEHYTEDFRWYEGYRADNRPAYESGFDLNHWTWVRKRKHWRKPIHIVTPSQWLADCVRKSALMKGWPVNVVPNPIDTDRWQPVEQSHSRSLWGLPSDVPLLLFGARGGGGDPRKGFDLMLNALKQLRGKVPEMQLIVFGQLAPRDPVDLGFPVYYAGHQHDDLSLRLLYNSADLLVIPSRQDNLPNTGVEALSCGTPVVAFDTGGLSDIVNHKITGYLAEPFDVADLAQGIRWVLDNKKKMALSENARKHAIEKFSYPVVAHQYKKIYQAAMAYIR